MLLIALGIFILFFLFAWHRFSWALALFIIGLPAFLGTPHHTLRFSIGPFPTTFIEVAFGAIFLVWMIRYARKDIIQIKQFFHEHRWLGIFCAVFFIASVSSIFVSGEYIPALGIWRAYFLEPMVLFGMLMGRSAVATPPGSLPMSDRDKLLEKRGDVLSPAGGEIRGGGSEITTKLLIWSLTISTISISFFGIYQHFTGADSFSQGLGRPVIHRITSFFTSPNAVGLYMAPILFLIIGLLGSRLCSKTINKDKESNLQVILKNLQSPKVILLITIGLIDLIALALTKSEGILVAIGAGTVVWLFFVKFRKLAITLCLLALIAGVSIPKIREALLFHDPSGRVRLSLWQDSWEYVTASPRKFLGGAGLRKFTDKIQAPAQHNDFRKIEKQLYPHMFLLNFWVETGLFGTISFLGIVGYLIIINFRILKKNMIWGASLLGMITVVVVHGFVDVPYFKNDLAMLWWILSATVFSVYYTTTNNFDSKETTSIF